MGMQGFGVYFQQVKTQHHRLGDVSRTSGSIWSHQSHVSAQEEPHVLAAFGHLQGEPTTFWGSSALTWCCLMFRETLLCSSLCPLPFVPVLGITDMSLASSSLPLPIHSLSWVMYCQQGLYLIIFPWKSVPQKGLWPKKPVQNSVPMPSLLDKLAASTDPGLCHLQTASCSTGHPTVTIRGDDSNDGQNAKLGVAAPQKPFHEQNLQVSGCVGFSPCSCCLLYLTHITFLRTGSVSPQVSTAQPANKTYFSHWCANWKP